MSLKGKFYKYIMKTAGKNSKCIQLATTCGLNSAEMTDYIYNNLPAATTKGFGGKLADSIFLNLPTLKSLRKRKQNLQNVLYYIINGRLERDSENEIRILDLASGYGQYIFPVLDKLGERAGKIYVEMRDINPSCENHIYAQNKNNYNIKFINADMKKEEYYDLNNKYDIVILTGFYDSIGMNNIRIIESTMKLAEKIMNDNGLFIYSYQESHTNSALLNELFNNTNRVSFSMGDYSKTDIYDCAKKSGFNQIGKIIDNEGVYPIVISAKSKINVDVMKKMIKNDFSKTL